MCYCSTQKFTYHDLYNDAYCHQNKETWVFDWIRKLDDLSCRRCSFRISANILKAITTQSIFAEKIAKSTQMKLVYRHRKNIIARHGAAKTINKKIARHLWRPNGIMMKKLYKSLID